MEKPAEQDPRVYFAAERTFLAWIRTGLGLLGVGFAVARFGLFLREFRAGETHSAVQSTGLSEWSGVALVILGVLVTISATVRHLQLVRSLAAGTWVPGQTSKHGILLALLLALIGLVMAGYLILVS